MITLEQALGIEKNIKDFSFNGQTFTMQLLSSGQIEEVNSKSGNLDDISRFYVTQKEILARSIIAINGSRVKINITKDEEKELSIADINNKLVKQNLDSLDKASQQVISILYSFYIQLVEEEEKRIERLKKKEQTNKVDISGN
jgi:hypothetical protein